MSNIHPDFRQHELPIAGVLNNPKLRANRSLGYKGVRLHVSDLIKSSSDDKFCVREHAIKNIIQPTIISGVLPASFDLLFELGNALHDNARNRWMQYSKDGRKRVLARWSCLCGDVKHNGVNPDGQPECKRCGSKPLVFDEYEFVNKKLGIIAHPDFLVVRGKGVIKRGYFDKANDVVHPVEIKGIDREDLNWDTLDGPLGEHTIQGSMYHWLGEQAGYRMYDGISYLYGDRAVKKSLFRGTPWKEFVRERDDQSRIDRVLAKAVEVNRCVDEKEIPERTVCTSQACTRAVKCAMSGICFSIPQAKVEMRNGEEKAKSKVKRKNLTVPVIGQPKDSYRPRPKPIRKRHSGS